jgi:hypothetical protein
MLNPTKHKHQRFLVQNDYKSRINVSHKGKVITLTRWNSPNQSLKRVPEKKKKNLENVLEFTIRALEF